MSRLIVVRQQRNIDNADILQFELSPVPPALIDEYGCLRKRVKAVIVKSLGVIMEESPIPDMILIDGGQLLYHIDWPAAANAKDLTASICNKLVKHTASK